MDLRLATCDLRSGPGPAPRGAPGCPQRTRRGGFSFTELLFAVMIMGIGFIMIAAIFPVGLSQSKSNFDETQAAALARQAVNSIGAAADSTSFIAPAEVTPLIRMPGKLGMVARNNTISPADPRYASIVLYRRATPVDPVQLYVFVVNRSDPFVVNRDFNLIGSSAVLPVEARPIKMTASPATVTINYRDSATNGHEFNMAAAGPGGFLIVQNDGLAGTGTSMSNGAITAERNTETDPTKDPIWASDSLIDEDVGYVSGRNVLGGRVYRLGAVDPSTAHTFEWFPGAALDEKIVYTTSGGALRRITVTNLADATGYVIGRNRVGPNEFTGGVMDVAYYTTFIAPK